MKVYIPGNNEGGNALIQVLIATAVSTGLVLAVSSFMQGQVTQQMHMMKRGETKNLSDELHEVAKTLGCGSNDILNGIAVTNFNPTTSYNLPAGLSSKFLNITAGTKYGNITVQNVRIAGYRDMRATPATFAYTALDDGTDLTTSTRIKASLNTTVVYNTGRTVAAADPADGQVAEVRTIEDNIPVVLTVDRDTGMIEDCSTEDAVASAESTCSALGFQWANGKCLQECNAGFDDVDGTGKCVAVDTNQGLVCSATDPCGTDDRFKPSSWPTM